MSLLNIVQLYRMTQCLIVAHFEILCETDQRGGVLHKMGGLQTTQ